MLPVLFASSIFAQKPDALPPPEGVVTVIKPERGFIDDSFAIDPDGTILYYVHTDGAGWANLRAVGLPPPPIEAAPPPNSALDAPVAAPVKAPQPSVRPAKETPAHKGARPAKPALQAPAPAPAKALSLAPGTSVDVLTGLELSIIKVALLPDERVLFVMRDLDIGGAVNGAVYSLRTRTRVPISGQSEGQIGPASDIVLGESSAGPVIIAMSKPDGQRPEYSVKAWNATTLRLLGQRSYKPRDSDGRVQTAQGSALPLYYIDDYQTLVAKHDGLFDKKKDIRQPDFLAMIDTLTGKLRSTQTISDPSGLLELARLHKDHSESVFPLFDSEAQKLELLWMADRPATEGAPPAENRSELRLSRPTNQYDGATLRYKKLRIDRLLFSLTVDPVNEQAVAQRRSAPDDIDFFLIDPSAQGPISVQKLRTLPGHKRPSAWSATPALRLALLRKHKNFPRGGTQIEVYDLAPAPAAPASP